MQAIILAAGFGMRCRPFTSDLPKALLEVNNLKLIDYQLWALKQTDIKDLVIVVGHSGEVLTDYINKYYQKEFNIQFIENPYYGTEGKNGSEVSLFQGLESLTSSEVLILESDLLYHPEILSTAVGCHGNTMISGDITGSGDEVFLVVDTNKKVTFLGKGANEEQRQNAIGEFVGITTVTQDTLALFQEVVGSRMKHSIAVSHYEEVLIEITAKIEKRFSVMHCPHRPWIEIDTPMDLTRAMNEIWPQIKQNYLLDEPSTATDVQVKSNVI